MKYLFALLFSLMAVNAHSQGYLGPMEFVEKGDSVFKAGFAPPLVVLDSKEVKGIRGSRLKKLDLAAADLEERVYRLLKIKKRNVCSFRVLRGKEATNEWGVKGFYGVIEVVTCKRRR